MLPWERLCPATRPGQTGAGALWVCISDPRAPDSVQIWTRGYILLRLKPTF